MSRRNLEAGDTCRMLRPADRQMSAVAAKLKSKVEDVTRPESVPGKLAGRKEQQRQQICPTIQIREIEDAGSSCRARMLRLR